MKSLKSFIALLALSLFAVLAALPAAAETEQVEFTAAELDQMLAPIALYPDTVLSHVLIASTYPLEVVQADRWARANPGLEPEAAVAAVEDQDWDPSVKALIAFPQILDRMSSDLAWTQRLGNAFLDSEARVMDAIQNLRNKAYASGSLDRLEHVRVQKEKEVIIIEPSVERVVYVPVYDTRVVYGNWWWNDYPPIYWNYSSHYTYVNGFYWGPRVYVAPSFYFSSFHWHRRHIVYVDYHRGHHPRFNNSRSVVNYSGARHWHHNPSHRRGVAYHNDRVRQSYGSNRESYRAVRETRDTQWRRNQDANHNARQSRDVSGERRTHVQQGTVRHESERVRDRLANTRQSDSTRESRSNDRDVRINHRGNTTLPSREDPRTSSRERERTNIESNRANERQERLQRLSEDRVNTESRTTNTESRRNLESRSNSDSARPTSRIDTHTERTSTEQRSQRVERAERSYQPSRSSSIEQSRPMRTESRSRPESRRESR